MASMVKAMGAISLLSGCLVILGGSTVREKGEELTENNCDL